MACPLLSLIYSYIIMTIQETEQEIIDEFSVLDDWMDRYSLLIDQANDMPAIDEQYKTDSNLIEGCQSRVWLQADLEDGKVILQADSDAILVRGIAALLVRVFNGHTPQEIIDADLTFIDAIGLREHLSPTRSNGLLAMIKQIKLYALAFQAKA